MLHAPALPDADATCAVCESADRPVNVLAGGAARQLSVDELGELGVRRISHGSTLSRAAMSAVVHAARHVAEFGTFPDMSGVLSGAEINDVLGAP